MPELPDLPILPSVDELTLLANSSLDAEYTSDPHIFSDAIGGLRGRGAGKREQTSDEFEMDLLGSARRNRVSEGKKADLGGLGEGTAKLHEELEDELVKVRSCSLSAAGRKG